MQDLVKLHGTSRNTLEGRHKAEFEGDSLFHQFARAVCGAKVIPRKELFEAWTVALHVHDSFPNVSRIADLACSHGLVSWALLLLYEQTTTDHHNNHSPSEDDTSTTTTFTTAVCIDKFMSPSAEKLQSAMLETWPHLHDRWDYVEGDIDSIIPCSSTLLVAVHACSKLSDVVIDLALNSHAPLVLVPCCHSKKCLPQEYRQKKIDKVKIPNLADFIDTRRVKRLQDGHYKVEEVYIPLSITPKNRVLIATPSLVQPQEEENDDKDDKVLAQPQPPKAFGAKARFYKNFVIPIGNSSESKTMIKIIAGREAANQRKAPVPPMFGVCVILPPEGDITVDEFRSIIPENVTVRCLQPPDKPHVDEKSGMRTRTFRVIYVDLTSKKIAKECQIRLCHDISKKFPGARPRQFPR